MATDRKGATPMVTEELKLYELLFEAVMRRIPALAEQIVEALRPPVQNTLTSEVTRMQESGREAQTHIEANAATLAEQARQIPANAATLREQATKIASNDARIAAQETQIAANDKTLAKQEAAKAKFRALAEA